MPQSHEAKKLFSALKRILKQKKISYKELAERTGTAESTVKRIFSVEECSVGKLGLLVNAIGLSLSELVEFAGRQGIDSTVFSERAEKFLSRDLELFFFYRKLFLHKDVGEVRKRGKLTKEQTTRYLKTLDDLEIIKWLPGDKVRFLHPGFLRFREDGPLKEAVYKAWAPKLHNYVINHMGDRESSLRLFSGQCTPDLRAKFLLEFEDLVERFLQRASLEGKIHPSGVRPIGVSLAVGPLRVGLDESDFS